MAKNSENQLLFKASLFSLTILYCQDADISQFAEKLKRSVKQSPKFFQHAPILLDIEQMKNVDIQFDGVIDLLRHYEMIPVGVRGGTQEQQQQAIDFGLAVFPLTQQDAKEKEKINPSSYKPAKIIQHPVRSGQQIYAQGSDLIITAAVSDGAEVLADGNIHVYGTLRGRALAGVSGDLNARIFCHQLEAQLVSIAGHYLVYEHKPAFDSENKAIQIYLESGHLQIKSL